MLKIGFRPDEKAEQELWPAIKDWPLLSKAVADAHGAVAEFKAHSKNPDNIDISFIILRAGPCRPRSQI